MQMFVEQNVEVTRTSSGWTTRFPADNNSLMRNLEVTYERRHDGMGPGKYLIRKNGQPFVQMSDQSEATQEFIIFLGQQENAQRKKLSPVEAEKARYERLTPEEKEIFDTVELCQCESENFDENTRSKVYIFKFRDGHNETAGCDTSVDGIDSRDDSQFIVYGYTYIKDGTKGTHKEAKNKFKQFENVYIAKPEAYKGEVGWGSSDKE